MTPYTHSAVIYDFANAIDMDGTGNVQSGALTLGRWYTLFVDDNDIRVMNGSSAATATTSSPYVAGKSQISFLVETSNQHLAIIHADGASAHKAQLVPSSPA